MLEMIQIRSLLYVVITRVTWRSYTTLRYSYCTFTNSRHKGCAQVEEDEFDEVDHKVEELSPMTQTHTRARLVMLVR